MMASESKKRKRADEDSGAPGEKPGNGQKPGFQVTVSEFNKANPPLIVSTPGTKLENKISFQPYQRDASKENGTPHEILVHCSEHAKIDYIAREEPSEGGHLQLKHYVGVFNPKENKLQIVEARNLVMRNSVRQQDDEDDRPKYSALERMNALSQAFGTRKSKKLADSYTLNAIAPENRATVSKDVKGALKLSKKDDALLRSMGPVQEAAADNAELLNAVEEAKPRPKANLAATKAADVYAIADLLGGSEMIPQVHVLDWIEATKKNEPIETSSRYIAARLAPMARRADAMKDSGNHVLMLRVLKYLKLLIDLAQAYSESMKGDRVTKMPKLVELENRMQVSTKMVEKVLERFSNRGKADKYHVDYLRTHIAALALVIDRFTVDIFPIQEDLRVDKPKMIKYFQEAGCHIRAPNQRDKTQFGITNTAVAKLHTIAELKIPLMFPKTVLTGKVSRKRR